MKYISLALACLLLPISAFSQELNEHKLYLKNPNITDVEVGELRDITTKLYNTATPYYVEVCTASKSIPKVRRTPGSGNGGHATIFLNGACLDDSKEYPLLKMCGDDVDLTDPNTSGVGVTLNLMFSNVRFIAIPGRDNFYKGPASWDEKITPELVEETREYYYKQPWFDGVVLAPEQREDCYCRLPECTKKELKRCMIDKNTGIDFAITYARSSYCTRLPMPKSALTKVVESLNASNTEAFEKHKRGERGYTYDVLTDNCSHLIHNAIAASGFFDPKTKVKPRVINKVWAPASEVAAYVNSNYLSGGEFGLMSVPIHNINRIAFRSMDLAIDDIDEMYKNKDLRKMMAEHDWIPATSGAIVTVMKQRQNNTAFVEGDVGVSFFLAEEHFERFMDPTDSDNESRFSNVCDSLDYLYAKHRTAFRNIEKAEVEASFKRNPDVDKLKFLEEYRNSLITSVIKLKKSIKMAEPYCQ